MVEIAREGLSFPGETPVSPPPTAPAPNLTDRRKPPDRFLERVLAGSYALIARKALRPGLK